MVEQLIQFFVNTVVPNLVSFLGTLFIAPGVSLFGFFIAIALLSILIGGVLLR